MENLKATLRQLLPGGALEAYRRHKQRRQDRRERRLSAEQMFTLIYTDARWGGARGSFCSGSGSHEDSIVGPYIRSLATQLQQLGAGSLTAVDLGCGDFSIGRQLAQHCGRYVGVDIVKPLIEHNQASFGRPRVAFRHLNIIEDALPEGDICFVRQVFQHLSNAQILAVLPKLARYRWCFITEHHPSAEQLRSMNLDKRHGADIRLYRGSGVFLERPPFNIPQDRYRLVLEVPGQMPPGVDPGVIRTFLFEPQR